MKWQKFSLSVTLVTFHVFMWPHVASGHCTVQVRLQDICTIASILMLSTVTQHGGDNLNAEMAREQRLVGSEGGRHAGPRTGTSRCRRCAVEKLIDCRTREGKVSEVSRI
jgi:hypothetical protein